MGGDAITMGYATVILRQDVTVAQFDVPVAREAFHFVNLAVINLVLCFAEQPLGRTRESTLGEPEPVSLGERNLSRRIDLKFPRLLQRQEILAAVRAVDVHPAGFCAHDGHALAAREALGILLKLYDGPCFIFPRVAALGLCQIKRAQHEEAPVVFRYAARRFERLTDGLGHLIPLTMRRRDD